MSVSDAGGAINQPPLRFYINRQHQSGRQNATGCGNARALPQPEQRSGFVFC
jgi:hypothetical protein